MTKSNTAEAANGGIKKTRRGFAAMSPERRKEYAARGGRKAQASGKVKHWTPAEAVEAGRKGGIAVSNDREHMSRIANIPKRRREEARARLLERVIAAKADADQEPEDVG